MTGAYSLRARLITIILPPILAIALLAGLWQLQTARSTAEDVFNKTLLAAALAVANDVAISGGDALSVRTRDILESAAGGLVFYHVYAPDGVIVAGYATPPVGIDRTGVETTDPTYFEARYLGRDVSGVRLQTQTEIDGLPGRYTTTVWQDGAARAAFVWTLVAQSAVVSLSILAALALVVWFGVRRGLRSLLDLEEAIAKRSSSDLAPIQRAVPQEVTGIVATLNTLFGQVSHTMKSQSEFIANAAHQLRNPIAGVLAMAEATVSAKTPDVAQRRAQDLLKAAQSTSALSAKLLMLERAEALSTAQPMQTIDLSQSLADWVADYQAKAPASVQLSVAVPDHAVPAQVDPVMLREAIVNLFDNSIAHGGPDVSQINVSLSGQAHGADITVQDNGRGIAADDIAQARQRFVQLGETGSTGLGLAIVDAVATAHGGHLDLRPGTPGLTSVIRIPAAGAAPKPSEA